MTTTYARLLSLLAALGTLLVSAQAQSLEDKVSQARRLQAESMPGMESTAVDSLIAEKRAAGRNGTLAVQKPGEERLRIDTMLTGPSDSLEADFQPDSLYAPAGKDSLSKSRGKWVRKRHEIPKRYEQRIFRSVDRSLFASTAGAAGREYILGPGDEITLALWGDKEKEYNLVLSREGKVFMEGIGQVALAGRTLDGAQELLHQKLAKIYSGFSRGTTHLDLSLGRTAPIRVFILGNVKLPGGYVFSGQSSVLSALYYAKGPSDIGTVRNMRLTRSGNKFSLDLYQYLIRGESLSPNVLQDGDIIHLGRAEALVDVSGDVGRPAVYELKSGEGIKEALEFAGNINSTAATHRLTLQRVFPSGKPGFVDLAPPQDYVSGKAVMALQDGDKLLVEKSTEAADNFLTISGPVKYPGTYEAAGTTTVPQLVAKAGGLREDAYLGRVHIVRFKPDGSSSLMAYSLDSVTIESITLEPKDNILLYSTKDMFIPDSIMITGAVFNPGKYQFRAGMTAKDLVMQAGGMLPHHESGRLLVFRGSDHEQKVTSIDLDVEDNLAVRGQSFKLVPNDFVQVPVDPRWYQKEVVSLEGLFMHPGKYSLLYPGEKLSAVIARAGGFRENGYVEGGRFFRSKDSVGRVGVDIRQAVDHPRGKMNIPMVGGDSIYIPDRLNTVKVIGDVGFETSVLFKEGATAMYYIERAGGFTRRSEKNRVVVQYANGESSRDGFFNRKPDAGSVIYVPQGPDPKPVDWFAGLNALLGTAGVIAALVLTIQVIGKK